MELGFQIIVGWFVIDFLTGIYHYILDHTSPKAFLLGKQAADFAEHHINPGKMGEEGVVALNALPFLGGLVALVFALFGWPVFWFTVFVGATISQQSHWWSHHRDEAPKIVQILQDVGILISPATHLRHHDDVSKHYGILNGWSHGTFDLLVKILHLPV